MSLEIVIREICKNLVSNRANERKKAAESLKKYLETGKEVPSLLSQNTLNKTGYNWNHVFDDIHAYIIKETEKFETSKTFQTVTVPLCTSLLQLCVNNANNGRAFIKCEKLTDACLHILVDSRLAVAIGDAYLKLLYKYILPNDNYLIYISPTTWENLLDVCVSACLSKTSSLDSVMKLKLVWLVIKNATNYCQFVIPLRSTLSKIRKYFVKCVNNKKIHELEIIILILETLSTESRLSICEFMETVLPSIFKSYDQNFDQKTKSALFRLLEITVMLHHPEGRSQGIGGSLAHNWDLWSKHLDSIVEIVCSEIAFKQKQTDFSIRQCQHFSYVAAAVLHQVFQSCGKRNEEDCASSSKLQKVSSNNNKCFKDLVEQLEGNYVPWIGITHAYIKHFGSHNISVSEYLCLLRVLEKILTYNKKINKDDFEDLACLTVSKSFACLEAREPHHLNCFVSFWNCCVRNSATGDVLQKTAHAIMLEILNLRALNYQQVEPLFIMYLEERMPVNDNSLGTLISIINIFYGKCCCPEIKMKCLSWLFNGKITGLEPLKIKEILLNLVTNVNVTLNNTGAEICERSSLYDVLFNTIDKFILFSEFEYLEQSTSLFKVTDKVQDKVEVNTTVANIMYTKMEIIVPEYMEKLRMKEVTPLEYAKLMQLIVHYFDILLTYTTMPAKDIESMTLFGLLNNALKQMYDALKVMLKGTTPIRHKITLLQRLQDLLHANYHTALNSKIRVCIDKDFFRCINEVLRSEDPIDDGETMYEEDDTEISTKTLKHNCILLLAEYCRKQACHTNEILRCILDSDLYDFKSNSDVDIAFRCIELLNEAQVDQPPLELTFTLMLDICQKLFRNPSVSRRLLQLMLRMIDNIWIPASDDTKSNIVIMIKSYLQRCTNGYYPPHTAVLVYECAARIIKLSTNQTFDQEKRILIRNVNSSLHTIRLFSCYLIKIMGTKCSEMDIRAYMEQFTDIFLTDISAGNECVLSDESANRTATLLHGFYGLVQAQKCLVHDVIMKIVEIQAEKSLDKHMVRKVLSLLSNEITSCSIEAYLSNNIVNILYHWFMTNKHFYDFPVFLFGYDKELFMEKHVKWLAAADVLWYKKGDAKSSLYLNRIADNRNMSVENIVEMCYCNIIALCLPYVVCEKYNISMDNIDGNVSGRNASKLLEFTRLLLKQENWNNLLVENLAEIVLMAASNLCDFEEVQKVYGVKIPQRKFTFTYRKDVFLAILRYFREMLDGNIIQILCSNQPLAVLHILNKLYGNVFKEKVFEFRILFLHSYLTFIDAIPLGLPSDGILCNFACVSLIHAIQVSEEREEVKILVGSLKNILMKIVFHNVNIQKAVVSKAFSILTIKKEGGFSEECKPLLTYLTQNVKECMKDGDDVVDFICGMSQGDADASSTVSKGNFKEKLESYLLGLCHTSIETLMNLRNFLRTNRHFINILCEELSVRGFSEDCEKSVVHQVIYALSNIIKTASNDKMKIEACNCLAEIGTYDIKTLTTVCPADNKRIVNTLPKQYFANVALKACSDILFNENPSTCNKVIEALSNILKFPDGRKALDSGEINKEVLKCLSQSNSGSAIKFPIDGAKLKLCSQDDYWVPHSNECHTRWVTRITVSLLDVVVAPTNFIGPLREVCLCKPAVCGQILPSLIGLILYYSSEVCALIGRQLNSVLHYIWNKTIDSTSELNILDYNQKHIVQYLLDVVNFVRIQERHYDKRRSSAPPTYNYLDVDYSRVSCAARAADQHLHAVYYGELWASARGGGVPPAGPAATAALEGGHHVLDIFRKCFASIGELDAVEGCGTGHLRSDAEKRRHFVNSGQYMDALQLHDIALAREGPQPELLFGVVAALHRSGMHYLALQYIQTSPDTDERLNDVKYDCLSYLGDWSSFVDTRELREKVREPTCQPNSILKAFRYACLKNCLNITPSKELEIRLEEPLDGAKLAAAKLCQSLNMENCQSVYQVVEYLHLFRDIDQYHSVRSGKLSVTHFVNDWSLRKLPAFNDFKDIESLIAQRSVILDHTAKHYKENMSDIVELQLQYAELGLKNERIQLAQRVLALVKDIDTSGRVPLVESQVAWAKGHKDIALSLLHGVVANPSNSDKLSAESVRQYGLWMAECKRENTREIINKYLEQSLELSATANDLLTKTKVSYDIAKFADEEYKQVATYMKSHTFENKVKCMKNIKDTAATFRGTQALTGDEKKAYATNNAFGALEEAEISNTVAERQSFLVLAMRYYLLSLIQSDEYNLSIFRVVSLWLDNWSLELGAGPDGLAALLHAIPSWKFLAVLPQLAPRLSNEDTPFAKHLRDIIIESVSQIFIVDAGRCAVEHPHHTLPILFNLKNSDKDHYFTGTRISGVQGSTEARVVAAGALVASLADREPALTPVLAQMERLCDAMISFAYLAPQKKAAMEPIPRTEPLMSLRQLDAVPLPTDTVPVSRRGDYSTIISLISFEKYYELVGGVNCPKKISCYCTDGKKRILLIKGQDDLRQDAMMQQVFNIVNTLLEENPVTNRNKLYIRTYKVVPLSRQSGVLEWCEGTTPLGVYLVNAHSTLRPQDMSSSAARLKLVECHEKKRSNEQKLHVFLEILKKFRPIFHYFFTERYLDPVTWYERRLAYTRSVAASSMVGYIMGLGDRHVKNILIDECTAEIIHIDFGIAFDQGKTLRTPETVPFRLTQDIIAGFGCNGVEGVFRRCCEKTLQLLRDNQETLLTILEVLLCDPLHSWVVSEKKLRENSIQCSEEVPVGGLAERALLAVRRKLTGGGGGAVRVSARGHVARLLATAADPANLCRLFPGWQPYL